MKKVLTVLLAIVMVLGLVGCSSGKETTTPSEKEATDPSGSEESVKLTAEVIDVDLTDEQYAFGVDKNQPELLAKANEYIAKIMSDGTFEAICDKYFGDGTPEPVESAEEDASKDQLVVATNAEFEPFEYMDGDSYFGIDMEIAKGLADFLGKELVIANMDFDAVCLSVGQQKCDIAMAGLTVNADREEYVTFTDSYYNAAQVLVVPSDKLADFADAKDAAAVEALIKGKVGGQNGTTGQFYVEGDEDWGFDGLEGTEFVGYKNGALAIQDMLNGNIDFVVIDKAPALAITEAINGK